MSKLGRFLTDMDKKDMLDGLKRIESLSGHVRAKKLKFAMKTMEEYKKRHGERFLLEGLQSMPETQTFTAVVDGRGFSGRHRTVLLKEIRLFGIKFLILADHMWVRLTRSWERAEPFLQGQKVLIYGHIIEYERLDETVSYSIEADKVTKL